MKSTGNTHGIKFNSSPPRNAKAADCASPIEDARLGGVVPPWVAAVDEAAAGTGALAATSTPPVTEPGVAAISKALPFDSSMTPRSRSGLVLRFASFFSAMTKPLSVAVNICGAGLSCYASILIHYLPFIILEAIWCGVGLLALIRGK